MHAEKKEISLHFTCMQKIVKYLTFYIHSSFRYQKHTTTMAYMVVTVRYTDTKSIEATSMHCTYKCYQLQQNILLCLHINKSPQKRTVSFPPKITPSGHSIIFCNKNVCICNMFNVKKTFVVMQLSSADEKTFDIIRQKFDIIRQILTKFQ